MPLRRKRPGASGVPADSAGAQLEGIHAMAGLRPPRRNRASRPHRSGSRSGPARVAPSKGKVLLVDDDDEILTTMGQVMEAMRPEVETLMRHSGKEALLALKSTPGIGVVVSDYRMPDMDGLALAEEVHKEFPAVAVVLATGFHDRDVRDLAAGHGISGFLSKPFTAADFIEVVQSALDSKHQPAEGATTPSIGP